MGARVGPERSATVEEFYLSLMADLPQRHRAPAPPPVPGRRRAIDHPRWLFFASVACALVSLVSAGVAHVEHNRPPAPLTIEDAETVLRTVGDYHQRRDAIESLRRRALQAIRRLELTRDMDILMHDFAADALEDVQEALHR